MNKIIVTIEILIILALIQWYVIPNWIYHPLTFSDLFVLEAFYFLGDNLYKQLKNKI
jgi:hypothetical protein